MTWSQIDLLTLSAQHVTMVDVTAQVPSNLHPSPATIDDMASCILTDAAEAAYEAADDMSASVPSNIFPAPAASCDMASGI